MRAHLDLVEREIEGLPRGATLTAREKSVRDKGSEEDITGSNALSMDGAGAALRGHETEPQEGQENRDLEGAGSQDVLVDQ